MFLLLFLALSRPYHVETVASLATSRHTHVQVTGRVTVVRREADGDWHIRITDGTRFVIAEIIPTLRSFVHDRETSPTIDMVLSIEPPKVGQCVRVKGIRRIDNEAGHGWPEIHPVEALDVVSCR